jgi:hypothetical protein
VTETSAGNPSRRWTQNDITALRSGVLVGHTDSKLAQMLGREIIDLRRMALRLNLSLNSYEVI